MYNYEHLALDEVYDILLYNPDVHSEMKLNIVDNLIEYYTEIEEYEKCRNLQELRLVMEKEDESNNKKT
jgi:hypothetical protein